MRQQDHVGLDGLRRVEGSGQQPLRRRRLAAGAFGQQHAADTVLAERRSSGLEIRTGEQTRWRLSAELGGEARAFGGQLGQGGWHLLT